MESHQLNGNAAAAIAIAVLVMIVSVMAQSGETDCSSQSYREESLNIEKPEPIPPFLQECIATNQIQSEGTTLFFGGISPAPHRSGSPRNLLCHLLIGICSILGLVLGRL
ncbi:hypothetical protein DAPPUDRAFT_303024 [Daphnia pulex]|uniref:Uncharacterized protein n=1 Tax=Daphnia pulex TaxID=6669 RepID=E9FTQ0_DAPPU|nr:hypothetical protein DAPPUDRAFT_303024 [Daphnia pulex]|eukprot:EFX89604.1 hypothetical protein DAPPUDRAFT_303024 [Daphnia pulex]